jgi:molecular chaperone DnaJ
LCEIPVGYSTAVLGGEVEVPTLGDEPSLRLKVPEGTQSGKTFRLRGRGVRPVRGGATGDLLVDVVVETPVKLTKAQKELLRKFDDSLRESSRSHSPREQGWLDKARAFFERLAE